MTLQVCKISTQVYYDDKNYKLSPQFETFTTHIYGAYIAIIMHFVQSLRATLALLTLCAIILAFKMESWINACTKFKLGLFHYIFSKLLATYFMSYAAYNSKH